jgi:hypothetical protein
MKIRQAKKILRMHSGTKKRLAYISRLKPSTYGKALDYAIRCAILAWQERRKEVGE